MTSFYGRALLASVLFWSGCSTDRTASSDGDSRGDDGGAPLDGSIAGGSAAGGSGGTGGARAGTDSGSDTEALDAAVGSADGSADSAACADESCSDAATDEADGGEQPRHTLVVGLSTAQHSGTFDAVGQELTLELGAHSLRFAYNHGDHVFGVDWAAEHGISVLFMLGYGVGTEPTTEVGRQAYADRSAALAETFGDKVKYYEVWNEWNGGFGLGCGWGQDGTPCVDAAMYTDLLCRSYDAIKAVRSAALIVGGVTAGVDTRFIERMLDAGAADCMDMVAVHPYVFTETKFSVPYDASAAAGADKFVEAITAVHDLVMDKTGKDMRVVVSEDGRSDKLDAANYQATADYVTELFVRAKTVPFLEGIWWYQLEDVPNDAKGYGLVQSDNTKKPAFTAFQAAAR